MTPIVTGADIFRAKTLLTAAQIFGLDTTAVLVVPGIPGKIAMVTEIFQKYNFGTQAFANTASAGFFYGSLNSDPKAYFDIGGTGDEFAGLFSGKTVSQAANLLNLAGSSSGAISPNDSNKVLGAGIWLVVIAAGFNSGSAITATVDPAAQGLLYADTDTGTIQVDGDVTDPTYTVTGTGAGGLVTTVTVAGGTGVSIGGPFSTTVVTGSGDGTLQLSITAIRQQGDGTVEIDVLYQPI